MISQKSESERRWRLILGNDAQDELGPCSGIDVSIDNALTALYQSDRKGGLNSSSPNVTRWLGDIRKYFPSSMVQVMQKDALDRLGLKQMLLEPEMLQAVEPDVHLVGTLLSLNHIIPEKTKATARLVVQKVVDQLERKLANPLRQAIQGSLNRARMNRRPRHSEIDWLRTIKANLKHYQEEYRTVIPERRIGFSRKSAALRDIILCIDQSGSMAGSVVYSSVMGAVMASLRSLRTSLIFFDTAVVDMTPHQADPVDVLFGVQLGGGTDICKAISYCQGLVQQPQNSILILISDLIEGGNHDELFKRVASIIASGVQMITLLALDDSGRPCFDHEIASVFSSFGIPCFACTPDQFPDMMATAIQKQDIGQWAGSQGIVLERGKVKS